RPIVNHRPTARYVNDGTGIEDATLTRDRMAERMQATKFMRREDRARPRRTWHGHAPQRST
ncbi:hypothetical protein, partial [Burkholderia sp.]|uniref:hypothetical protein n=1 Tax=Burkholderia sp. TaxID=36773 RepID=UPI00258A3313